MKYNFVIRYLMFLFVVYVSLFVDGSQTFAVNIKVPEDSMMDFNDFKNEFSLETAINTELNEYRNKLNNKYKTNYYYDEDDDDDDRIREQIYKEVPDVGDDENYKSQPYNVDIYGDANDDYNNDNKYSSSSSSNFNIKDDIIQTDDDYIIAKRRLMTKDYPIPKPGKYKKLNSYRRMHVKESSGPSTTDQKKMTDGECQKDRCASRHTFLGTNLFGPHRKKCFYSEDVALLSLRYEFDTIIPKTYPPRLATDKDICMLLRFFTLINDQIESIDDERSQRLVQRAFLDTLGAYLHYYLVPNVKFSFYAGNLNLCTAKKVLKTYQECKIALNTNGNGWRSSKINIFIDQILNTVKPLYVKPLNASVGITSCSLLDLRSGHWDGMHHKLLVALPKLEHVDESNNHLANICLPFDKRRVFNILSSRCAFIFVKFYKILTYCHRNQRVSMDNYNYKLYAWIEEKLREYLCDHEFYPGLGGVLNVYMATKLCQKNRNYADALTECGNKLEDYDSADMDYPINEALSIGGLSDKTKFTRSIGKHNVAAVNKDSKTDFEFQTECPCPVGMSFPCEALGLRNPPDKKNISQKSKNEEEQEEEGGSTTEAETDSGKKKSPYPSNIIQATREDDDDENVIWDFIDENVIWDFIQDHLIPVIAISVGVFLVLFGCICCYCCVGKEHKFENDKYDGNFKSEVSEGKDENRKSSSLPQPITKPFWGLCHSRKKSRHIIQKMEDQFNNRNAENTASHPPAELLPPSTPTAGTTHFISKEKIPNIGIMKRERAGKRYTKDYDDLTTMTSSSDVTTPPERKYIPKGFAKKYVPPPNRSYYMSIEKEDIKPVKSESQTVVDLTTPPKSIIKRSDSPTKQKHKVKLTNVSRKAPNDKEKSKTEKHLADLNVMSKPPMIPMESSSEMISKKKVFLGKIFKRQMAGMDEDSNGRRDLDWETTYSSSYSPP